MKKILAFSFGILVAGSALGASVTAIASEVPLKEKINKLTHNEWNFIAQAVDSLADAFDGVIGDNLSVIFPADVKVKGKVLSNTGQFLSSTVAFGLNGFFADGTDGAEGLGFVLNDNTLMRIDTDGNVGIGDITPDASLKLDVEGPVGATEICDENGSNCHDLSGGWMNISNNSLASLETAASIDFGARTEGETVYGLTITSAIAPGKAGFGALRATSSIPYASEGRQSGHASGALASARGVYTNGVYSGVSGSVGISSLHSYSATTTSYGLGGNFSAGPESGGVTTLYTTGTTWLGGVKGRISGEINGTPSAGAVAAVIGIDDSTGTAPSYAGYFEGDIVASGDVTASSFVYSSDRRLKKNITPIEGALESVEALNGVSFEWKKNDKKQLGFIAQEVEKVLPALVETNQTTDLKAVAYGNITAVLVEAIKELKEEKDAEIAELRAQIAELQK